MSDFIIKVENLGKKYRIMHEQEERYLALRDVVARTATAPLRWLSARSAKRKEQGASLNGNSNLGLAPDSPPLSDPLPLALTTSPNGPTSDVRPLASEDFWALKDVSFEVKQGEVVGIIGRNGAGKSTLLKILSRITEPTEGRVRIRGRVASLLEVGTGFHPELTGRENIFVNGAILGMTRAEIKRKFDEIVAFADIEKFLDTPVKRYSSGMYVRLAFAVAAHLEPEILLVDEVLAVGDAAFQKKCLGKMGDVAKEGRTVLFVSHQMTQIRRLCQRCIWLHAGQVRKVGSMVEVVSAYDAALSSVSDGANRDTGDDHVAARFLRWEILEPCNEQPNILAELSPVKLRFILKVNKPIHKGHHGIGLYASDNQLLWGTAVNDLEVDPGIHDFVYTLPGLPLRPGVYSWKVSLYNDSELVDAWYCAPPMIVATEPLTHPSDIWQGILNLPWRFQVR